MNLNKFLDFDKNKQVFYYNMYLKEYKFVIKIPISKLEKEKHTEETKIEKFNLTKYTFLLNYEQSKTF